ncbi:DUF2804 domain-containing protein [Microbacterium bovistercoris]|uniref:DUF2804 domain-containing protein n=1 Tax=Microbacterium bovistercoris TaxID=2293570 RepID=A0A371NXA3_9MICO|nr:DUF2804 domain-containing protein [Microbacterium bovistercoris]REJ07669.1 DUF2804 domain-containing protein [Microbacterium bovistercoris]
MTAVDREIVAPVALLTAQGLQNPDAIGWTRTPLIDTDAVGRSPRGWGRTKRWEYWAVTTPTHIVAMTIGALDYANVRQVWLLDRATKEEIDVFEIGALSRGVQLPGTIGRGSATSNGRRVSLEFADDADGTLLVARSPRVQVDIVATLPPEHEAMGTAAPFTPFLAEFTVKDVDRPAHGTITVDGVVHEVPAGASWAVLDHLRGRLPYRTHWNWGAGAGMTEGRRIGLQLGGGGPLAVRHGVSQNAFTLDGRVHKVAGALEWDFDPEDWSAPWRVTGDRMELTFTSFHVRAARTQLVLVGSLTHQCFGHYDGRVRTDGGEWIPVTRILGWAEDVHNRW